MCMNSDDTSTIAPIVKNILRSRYLKNIEKHMIKLKKQDLARLAQYGNVIHMALNPESAKKHDLLKSAMEAFMSPRASLR